MENRAPGYHRFFFDLKLFVFLVMGFNLFTIFGTLSHEFGHYLVARALGCDAQISYAFTSYDEGCAGTNDELLITLGGVFANSHNRQCWRYSHPVVPKKTFYRRRTQF